MGVAASAGSFFAAWIIIILGLSVLANTSWGKSLVAYVLWLMIIFVVVTHWAAITEVLTPAATGLPVVDTSQVGLPALPMITPGTALH